MRLSHLEDTEAVVNVMLCILLRLLHVVNACFRMTYQAVYLSG
ncbi:hypothetical protein [Enterobacter phage E-4]|nr:hypothetical protein [Enterobacter phage E-4]